MNPSRMIKGTGVSSGVANGVAFVLPRTDWASAPRRSISPTEVASEFARFESALLRADDELVALEQAVRAEIGSDEADIFSAQRLVLRDISIREDVLAVVRDSLVNAEAALIEVIERFSGALDRIPNAYLRERAADVRDVGRRALAALMEHTLDVPAIPDGAIVVSEDLLPSTTARLELSRVRGFVTERGGKFSHAAILARSQGTPAVAGASEATGWIKTGDRVVVDGVGGFVFVNPDVSVVREFERVEGELRSYRAGLNEVVDLPSVTLDGTRITLLANVGKIADTESAILYRADGIGLYRTEFGYSIHGRLPTEEEQYDVLKRAAERLHPRTVVLRLLDMGGDKGLPYFPPPTSRNPALGERGVRWLLRHPEVLKPQLRAFLRVSGEHPIAILIPVVMGLDEIRLIRAMLRQVGDELAAKGARYDPHVPLGAMIEVPSAALLADRLAQEVEFFSLGTNDLVQYLLAADREDETSAPYYQPLHPAVLRVIHQVIRVADAAHRELTICGEMAAEPLTLELLLGLGLRRFSVGPGELLEVRSRIRRIHLSDAQEVARHALELGLPAEVEAYLQTRMAKDERSVSAS